MFPIAHDKAEQFAMRILPRGTKMSAMNLTDLRKCIQQAVLPLYEGQDELETLRNIIAQQARGERMGNP